LLVIVRGKEQNSMPTRRRFLAVLPPALGALLLSACGDDDEPEATALTATVASETAPAATATTATGAAPTQPLAPTPACGDDDEPTIAQTAGPYFTPNSPERKSLVESGMGGTRLVVEGFVLSTACAPVAGALVDFWQADDAGQYDNVGYRLRGHQFTDENGVYQLETILPGLYPGRTRHIHVKVQGPSTSLLTTQIYFPNEPANDRDRIFHPSLVVDMRDSAEGKEATFDFVLT
jgi:protocatechuate 3,4-dioxygenase beta subunit